MIMIGVRFSQLEDWALTTLEPWSRNRAVNRINISADREYSGGRMMLVVGGWR